jgi:hypothetical protein
MKGDCWCRRTRSERLSRFEGALPVRLEPCCICPELLFCQKNPTNPTIPEKCLEEAVESDHMSGIMSGDPVKR